MREQHETNAEDEEEDEEDSALDDDADAARQYFILIQFIYPRI